MKNWKKKFNRSQKNETLNNVFERGDGGGSFCAVKMENDSIGLSKKTYQKCFTTYFRLFAECPENSAESPKKGNRGENVSISLNEEFQ